MVPPCGFADTMTPPIASPADDLMLPLRMASAAWAGAGAASSATANTLIPRIKDVLRMASLLRCGRGNGLEIGDDGVDLRRLEMMLEARHARRAIADHLAHDIVLPAERLARQRRAVQRARQLRLGVTDPARLIEQPHAEKLLVVEPRVCGILLRQHRVWPHGQHRNDEPPRTLHPRASRMRQVVRAAGASQSAAV